MKKGLRVFEWGLGLVFVAACEPSPPSSSVRPPAKVDADRTVATTSKAAPIIPAKAVPLVSLNHLYRTVDATTYQAIRDSTWLKERFAVVEERSTIAGESSWTGVYLYGQHTYLEFFEGDDGFDRVGIGFSTEQAGAIAAKAEALTKAFGRPVHTKLRTSRSEGKDLPWFYMTRDPQRPRGQISSWVMEYHPDFVNQWHPELGDSDTKPEEAVRRDTLLRRYEAKLGTQRSHSPRHFGDISLVRLELGRDESELLRRELQSYGWELQERPKGFIAELAEEIRFEIQTEPTHAAGLQIIEFRLDPPFEGQKTLTLGSSSLQLDGPRASWRF